MNYPRIFERVYMQPLCVTTARFMAAHAYLLPRLTGKVAFEAVEPTTLSVPKAGERKPAPPNKSGYTGKRRQMAGPLVDEWGNILDPRFFTEPREGVAVVPVYGTLAKNLSSWEEACGGGADIQAMQEALRQAAEDDEIEAIILDIDSPGGEVTGIPEFGAQVSAAAMVKPVYAFTDGMMASAAYWIGSQATEVYVTPSSSTGSIGTYLAWLDESVRMQMEGIQLRLFAEGKHKGIGLPGRGLSQDDEELLRNRVKAINDQFQAAVRAGRADDDMDVDDETMQGQTFTGEDAVSRNLVDATVGSFEELLTLV